MEDKKKYFDLLAERNRSKSSFSRYYWNDIISYCSYFSHHDLRVLEVGCGTGDLLNTIPAKEKTGIDFSQNMIQLAKEKYSDIEFHFMAAEEIQLDKKYDLIILSNLVGYLDDIEKVFTQLHKVCHERTKIIVTYYNYFWQPILKMGEWIGLKTKTPEQNWLTHQDINNLLYLSGFEVYRTCKRMILPVYIPLLSSFFNRYLAKLPLIKSFSINFFSFAKPLQNTYPVPNPKSMLPADMYSVSVIIPARNESGNIENAILRMPKLGKHTEIIFVEGGSTDDTWQKMEQVQKKYSGTHDIKIYHQQGKGKCGAVKTGFAVATGDILVILDADLTVPPEDLTKFYDALASGKGDFINGSRIVYPMEKEAMRFLNLLGNRFFSYAFTWLLEQPFKDTLCGTKAIFRNDYQRLVANRSYFGDFDPFGDFDLIFGAYKLNLKIVEVPIRYRGRTYGTTNISRFIHGFILLRMSLFAARKIKFI